MRALVPGTFDPITLGHMDIIARAAEIFEEVIVVVAASEAKGPWFSLAERLRLAKEAVAELPGVEVDSFDGLLVQYAQRSGSRVIVKGLRAVSDFEYELQMAHTNRSLAPDIETLFVMTSAQYSFLSSRIVRELATFGADVSGLVPPNVVAPLAARVAERTGEANHRQP
ncbi:MAG: pantetheine-phosphate adenylyltransferase [Armatimonadetes bacterium]|nr:pantetheine-phosphate adenylyltransferase [Armatimonadota bacterium]